MDNIRGAHAYRVATAFLSEVPNVNHGYAGRFSGRQFYPPPNHFRIHSRSAKILAHFVHHQQVECCERNAGYQGAGQLKRRFLLCHDAFRQRGAHGGNLVQFILHYRHPAENFPAGQHFSRNGANGSLEPVFPALAMALGGPIQFAHADRHHFQQTAFNLPRKIGVGLDAV